MKTLLKVKLGILAIGTLALTSTLTQAQTTANGPYYATPSWDQTLPASTRFIVLSNMGGNAVLDRETGLVWEKSASPFEGTWVEARDECVNAQTGGRKGWRLPSMNELASLVDHNGGNPALPAGHPFTVAPLHVFWSATTVADNTGSAWGVNFAIGGALIKASKTFVGVTFSRWCVRGGMNADQY